MAVKEGFTSIEGKNVNTKYIQYTINMNGDLHSFFIFTPDYKKDFKIEKKINADGAALIVKQKNKRAHTLLFLNPGSKTVEILKKSTDKPFEIF